MPLQTDFNVSPYFDDYSEVSDYYKILFRPGVAVQTRELNQLQTILQKQVERFGDNIFKRGTIIDGCDITFHSQFPYVKIKDSETSGAPVNVSQYIGYNVRNQANVTPLVASVTTVMDGFESRNPDLNTLFVRYINSGFSNVASTLTEETTFSANQQLTVFDPRNIIEKVTSFNDSSGFSNTDSVVFTSAIAIQNSSGGTSFANNFYVGDFITDSVANAQIVTVDTTTNTEVVILRVKPRAVDLKAANADLWAFETNTNIQTTNTSASDIATIVGIIGSGAAGSLVTGALGEVDQLAVTQKGTGYYALPTVTISSVGATTGQIADANLVAQNFLTTISVANGSVSPIGSGYAMTVGDGIIYQKGYFSRVNEHLVVVEKYSNLPDLKAVGFDTTEEVINSNQDTSLLDNATGEANFTAPGANRLKLTPTLVTLSKAAADANSEFFSIAEFSNGEPYKQNRQTVYNVLGNEMARRTFEESGNYVLDQFILNTKSMPTLSEDQTQFKIQVDPGVAYVNGKRIETVRNYDSTVNKGTDTTIATNATVSLNYGNYIRMNQVGGTFIFKTGDTVNLYPVAKTYLATAPGTAPSSAGLGTALGTARIRSMVHESGTPGTPEAVYRLYLFDIRLATARNFSLVRSILYNGVNKGIGDAILEGGDAVLKDNNLSSLVYYAGKNAVKNANNISYIYRTVSNTSSLATNGALIISTTGGEVFPYTPGATLSTNQERDIIIVPLSNAQFTANIAGSLAANATSLQVNGTSTAFTSTLQAGDFIKIANTTANVVVQVNTIANNTVLYLKSIPTTAFTTGNAVIYLPQNVPISIDRATRTANVDANANNLLIQMESTINVATTVAVSYNVRSSNTGPVAKTVNRNRFVRLNLANNISSNTGPWALGIPDVFRLKKVFAGPNTTFIETDTVNVTDVTQHFYIDHNQTEDYYGVSYLYPKPTTSLAINTTDVLLVQLDHFTDSSEGLKGPGDSGTYNIDDAANLASSATTINTLEIPEMYGVKGTYYDLRDQFDFRPQSSNTVAANTSAANAPINPTEPTDAARFSVVDKRFPAPDSNMTGTIEYYNGRVDRVVIDDNGQFQVMSGTPGIYAPPSAPDNALTINLINIPPYPSVPYQLTENSIHFIDTQIANEKYTNQRLKNYRISTPIDATARKLLQPRGYTMVDIGKLERRISDLEYYTSFTLVEALTQKKVIPSSSNNAVDRFKFGFFVDGFNDYTYSDVTNPNYNASVVDGRLAPRAEEINLKAASGESETMLPYVESVLVSQAKSTDGPIIVDTPVVEANTGGGANTSTGTIVVLPPSGNNIITSNVTPTQITAAIRTAQKNTNRRDSAPYVFEDSFYTMSSTTGPVEIYLNSRDNNMAMEIFQSTTASGVWGSIKDSSTAAAITSGDVISKSLSLNGPRKIEHQGSLNRKSYGPVGNFIEDQFKMLFTHDPSNGIYYRVRVYKGKNHGGQGKSGTFEYKMYYPADSTVNNTTPVTGFTNTTKYAIGYDGFISLYDSTSLSLLYNSYFTQGITDYTSTSPTSTSYVAAEQQLELRAYGLKASTIHAVTLDGVDISSRIKQDGRLLGEGIITDASGEVSFKLYYGSSITPTTDIERAAADVLQQGGVKSIRIYSTDGSSSAINTIQIPVYAAEEASAPPAPISIAPTPTTSTNTTGSNKQWFFDKYDIQLF